MLDHIGISVSDLERSRRFFEAALHPLEIGLVMEVTAEQTGAGGHVGFGSQQRPYFWIGDGGAAAGAGVHVAFAAASRAVVDAYYAAAIGAGGRDNGAPGLRPHYHPNYYGAFVLDPDGHNIEAVCHRPE
ncbi:MAG: glyoxalase-like domain protein [Hydrocarboniphaga sp.]|uniref:VOC family protein n=1 Tax=Hydrocarboniphaga sp. TaxID=2033016 RepID=UPI002604172D|nr:VOC family protein [Hydrocarboniphaga sp.]MDB5972897.1 glyoxalase-like domain protein [Hydrocarboniphaga sp.]